MIKLQSLIMENYQLAKRIYGDNLTPADEEFLEQICHKDYTFKLLADLLMEEKLADGIIRHPWKEKDWQNAYIQLKEYHRNVFPIKNFSYDSKVPVVSKKMLKDRLDVMKILSKWPNIAKRNLRKDIAEPRSDFGELEDKMSYINLHLGYLDNRDDATKAIILKKVFSSDHPTFDDVLDFLEDKENLLKGGHAYSKDGLYELVKKHDYDLRIVYDKDNVVVVDVTGQAGMKVIGCNSLWCFTYGTEYGKGGEQFDIYSHNGHVYAIIDFERPQTSPDFIYILIKPFEKQTDYQSYLYNMANEETYGDARQTIVHLAGTRDILSVFKWEDL